MSMTESLVLLRVDLLTYCTIFNGVYPNYLIIVTILFAPS